MRKAGLCEELGFLVLLYLMCLFGYEADGETTARGFLDLQHVASLHHSLGDGIGLRISIVVGILRIGINGAVVFAALVEEVELDNGQMTILIALATHEPVVGTLGLTGYGDVVGRLGLEVFGVVPVAGHVANELEGVVVFLVVLRQIGSHLEG